MDLVGTLANLADYCIDWQGLVSASMLPLSFRPRTVMRLVRSWYAWTIAWCPWHNRNKGADLGIMSLHLASCLFQHTTTRAMLLLCLFHARPVDHSNIMHRSNQVASHPATAAAPPSCPLVRMQRATQTPWSKVECRVQGNEPTALGVG